MPTANRTVERAFWDSLAEILAGIGFRRDAVHDFSRRADKTVITCVSRVKASSWGGMKMSRITWEFALPDFPAGRVYETSAHWGPTVGLRSIVDFCAAPRGFELSISFDDGDARLVLCDPFAIPEPNVARLGLDGLVKSLPDEPIAIEGLEPVLAYLSEVLLGPFDVFTKRYGTRQGLLELLTENVSIAERELRSPFFTSRPERFMPWLADVD